MDNTQKTILIIDKGRYPKLIKNYLSKPANGGFLCEDVEHKEAFEQIKKKQYDAYIIELFYDFAKSYFSNQEPKIIPAIMAANPDAFIIADSTMISGFGKDMYRDDIEKGTIKKWFEKPVDPKELASFLKASL